MNLLVIIAVTAVFLLAPAGAWAGEKDDVETHQENGAQQETAYTRGELEQKMRGFVDDVMRMYARFFQDDLTRPTYSPYKRDRLRKGTIQPASDVVESPSEITITCDMPGMRKDDIHLSVEGDTLIIKGTREVEKERQEEEGELRVYRQERAFGSFERSLQLPDKVDIEKISAKYENGTLTVHLPKKEREPVKTRSIKVT
jgi:HSP20 family protein